MVDAEFAYTYEYQGNAPKLVHTPLTDKCYLTLTQGMFMGLGGNPYGPAGTGKTESVKALGGLFGRQVLVFNCDEVGTAGHALMWYTSPEEECTYPDNSEGHMISKKKQQLKEYFSGPYLECCP